MKKKKKNAKNKDECRSIETWRLYQRLSKYNPQYLNEFGIGDTHSYFLK